MNGYVAAALEHLCFAHTKSLDAPSLNVVRYRQDAQQPIPPPPDIRQITSDEEKIIERVVGTFLYYGQIVDPTVLQALSAIALSKHFGLKNTLEATTYLLNYLTAHPNAILSYHAPRMVLCVHSDASYLTETKAFS